MGLRLLRLGTLVVALVGCNGSGADEPETPDSTRAVDAGIHDAAETDAAVADAEVSAPDAFVQGEGCVDIWIDETVFDTPDRWRTWWPYPPLKQFVIDERGIHVAFHVLEYGGDPLDASFEEGQMALLTFDPETGRKTQERLFDIYPLRRGSQNRAVYDFDIAPDGTFAALVAWTDRPNPSVFEVVVGHLDRSELLERTRLDWPDTSRAAHQLAWDGEAFSIHGYSEAGWLLARVDLTGNLILPRLEVGAIFHVRDDTKVYATDPVTGATYNIAVQASSTGAEDVRLAVSGHARDGSLLPDIPREGVLVGPILSVQQSLSESWRSSLRPAVLARDSILWFGAFLSNSSNERRLSIGRADNIGTEPEVKLLTPKSDGKFYGEPRFVRNSNTDRASWPTVFVMAAPSYGHYVVPNADSEQARLLVVDAQAACSDGPPPCGNPGRWQVRDATGQQYDGRTWIGFVEYGGSAADPRGPLRTRYRIINAGPQCRYSSIRDVLSTTEHSKTD